MLGVSVSTPIAGSPGNRRGGLLGAERASSLERLTTCQVVNRSKDACREGAGRSVNNVGGRRGKSHVRRALRGSGPPGDHAAHTDQPRAEEIVQDAFLDLMTRWGRLRDPRLYRPRSCSSDQPSSARIVPAGSSSPTSTVEPSSSTNTSAEQRPAPKLSNPTTPLTLEPGRYTAVLTGSDQEPRADTITFPVTR